MNNKTEPTKNSLSALMYIFLLAFAIITLLSACGLKDDTVKTVGSETWETTESVTALPKFLNDHTAHTSELYGQVHEHTHVMGMLDCYCGCMVANEIDEVHDSLLRCYLAEYDMDDGKATWTDHSAFCGICKQELELVIDMKNKDSNDDEVIAAINAKFGTTH